MESIIQFNRFTKERYICLINLADTKHYNIVFWYQIELTPELNN